MENKIFELPYELRGKKIKSKKIIPTVCNIKTVINKLAENGGKYSLLKAWEKASYKHYNFEKIQKQVLMADDEEKINIIREHILNSNFEEVASNVFDIYIVAYIAEKIDVSKGAFIDYCLKNGMAGTENTANAIYSVGKGDGIFLKILYDDGSVRDWDFMNRWVNRV